MNQHKYTGWLQLGDQRIGSKVWTKDDSGQVRHGVIVNIFIPADSLMIQWDDSVYHANDRIFKEYLSKSPEEARNYEKLEAGERWPGLHNKETGELYLRGEERSSPEGFDAWVHTYESKYGPLPKN